MGSRLDKNERMVMPNKSSKRSSDGSAKTTIDTMGKQIMQANKPKSQLVHFRRCHICGCVNESNDEVAKCEACEKPMARFYYFDANRANIYTDDRLREQVAGDEYQPIHGLSLLW